MTYPLFDTEASAPEIIDDGAVLLRGFAADQAERWIAEVQQVQAEAPFRIMTRPGGAPLSVAMTNCGDWGWVSDEKRYSYSSVDPISGKCWPAIPAFLLQQAGAAAAQAGYVGFVPDACLINRYQPGTKLTLQQMLQAVLSFAQSR